MNKVAPSILSADFAVLGAEVVCVIGSKIVLYRESRKHKKLSLEIKAL